MGWTDDLLTGVAEHLAAHGVARWQPSGAYDPAGLPPITLRALPDQPDLAIALGDYTEVDTEDAGLSDVTVGVQIRSRGTADPATVEGLADQVWELLHGARMVALGSAPRLVHTSLIYRRSTALLGTDRTGRFERACNYYVTASRPNVHRPD